MAATLQERIEQAFAGRATPAAVIDASVFQFDSDVEEALWFAGRDWHKLTWTDWQEHSCAIHFFSPEAFACYLPSLLLLAAQNPAEWLYAAESLIWSLDRSPTMEGWDENFARRFMGLRSQELDVLKEWLLLMCEYSTYRGYGLSAAGPGDLFARAFETVDLIQKELGRRESKDVQGTSSDGSE